MKSIAVASYYFANCQRLPPPVEGMEWKVCCEKFYEARRKKHTDETPITTQPQRISAK